MSGSEDGTIKIWDLRWANGKLDGRRRVLMQDRTGQIQRNYNNEAPVNDLCIHPNQGELITCDQAGSIKLWDLSDNVCLLDLVGAASLVYTHTFEQS